MLKSDSRLMRLLFYRGIVSLIVLALAAYFYYRPSPVVQQQLLLAVAFGFGGFTLLQWHLARTAMAFHYQLFIQFALDLLLVSVLVFATEGIQSPFVFLFGLIIVVAGTQAHAMVVLITAVLAPACYLVTIHSFAWWRNAPLDATSTLQILLQVSALFLVGGVMALIAQRHAALQQERSRVVRQHRRLQELHDQVMSSMQEGILILDRDLYLQDCNDAARHLLNFGRSAAGCRLTDVVALPTGLPEFLRAGSGTTFQCEWQGERRHCLMTVTSLPGGDPDAYWMLTLVDITQLRQLERRLAEQHKLASMGRMAAMLAHEVRNPMQTIGQAVELLGSNDSKQAPRIHRIIAEETGRLNRLVSDMLDYVRPLRPAPAMAMLPDLVEVSVHQHDMDGQHAIACSVNVGEVYIDADHFRLVLDNLLRNALAASPEKGTVSVQLDQSDGAWELTICDQGGGIPQEMDEHLFEPFASGRSGGTGLGLATVWQVCEANGWSIRLHPVEHGTCFVIKGRMESEVLEQTENHG